MVVSSINLTLRVKNVLAMKRKKDDKRKKIKFPSEGLLCVKPFCIGSEKTLWNMSLDVKFTRKPCAKSSDCKSYLTKDIFNFFPLSSLSSRGVVVVRLSRSLWWRSCIVYRWIRFPHVFFPKQFRGSFVVIEIVALFCDGGEPTGGRRESLSEGNCLRNSSRDNNEMFARVANSSDRNSMKWHISTGICCQREEENSFLLCFTGEKGRNREEKVDTDF